MVHFLPLLLHTCCARMQRLAGVSANGKFPALHHRPSIHPFIHPSIRSLIHPSNHSLRASSAVQASNLWALSSCCLVADRQQGSYYCTHMHALAHMQARTHTQAHTHMHTPKSSNVVGQLPVACLPLTSVTQTLLLQLLVLLLHGYTLGNFQ